MTTITAKTSLNFIEINPVTKPVACVIWMHGLGADGNDFVPIVPELQLPATLPVRFIFPNAHTRPVTINNGFVMRAWYDIYAMSLEQRIDQEGIYSSIYEINQLIEQEEARGIPAHKIVLAGFSQGAVMSLMTGLRYPKKLAGILALSGYLPMAEKTLEEASPANQDIPIFLGHGNQDTVVPKFLGLQAQEALGQKNYHVTWHSYSMGHSVCAEEVSDISIWLQKTLMP